MRLFIPLLYCGLIFGQEKKIKFDPNKLNDPEPRWPKIISPFSIDSQMVIQEEPDSIQIIIEGFRVQVLATRDQVNGERLRNKLSESFLEKIYIIFESPNYKVRMGNFIDRRDAETLRRSLAKKGYPSASVSYTHLTLPTILLV